MGEFNGITLDDLVLQTDRLTLRPWRPEDADAVHTAMQDRRMHAFLRLPDPYGPTDAAQFAGGAGDEGRAAGTGFGCAVIDTRTGRLAGSAVLRLPRGPVEAEIGYAIYPHAQGHGFAAEAARELAEWGFAAGVGRIEIRCDVRNLASARSALRAGFGFEAILRDGGHAPDRTTNGALFARLARDAGRAVPPVSPGLPPGGVTDGVITLRATTTADAQALLEAEDAEAERWAFQSGTPGLDDYVRQADESGLRWLVGPDLRTTIVDVATSAPAGHLSIRLFGPPQVGLIGYGVHPAFRGRAYTSRALRLIAPWAFESGFGRLELGAKAGNVASQRAAAAGGFGPDGVNVARLRNADGTFSDEVRFALVNPAHRPVS